MATTLTKTDFLSRYYQDQEWRLQPFTVTYLEDTDPDTWQPIKNPQPNTWSSTRILWRPETVANKEGEGKIIVSCSATTKPGTPAVQNRMNPNGTFHILTDHFFKECWQIGKHITKHSYQSALVQCDTVLGTRDDNEDGLSIGDKIYKDGGGINQHSTANDSDWDREPPVLVNYWSFGCLVGKWAKTHHKIFMPYCVASGQKKFDTAVITGVKLKQWADKNNYVLCN